MLGDVVVGGFAMVVVGLTGSACEVVVMIRVVVFGGGLEPGMH